MTVLAFARAFRLSSRSAGSVELLGFETASGKLWRANAWGDTAPSGGTMRAAVLDEWSGLARGSDERADSPNGLASRKPPVPVTVRQISRNDIDRTAWDSFAGAAGASFQVSRDHLKAQALKGLGRERHRFFEFRTLVGGRHEKIGQCNVVKRRDGFHIQDGLQLLQPFLTEWRAAMEALLHTLGPGHYSYGGLWSCEQNRQAELASLAGVTIESVRPFSVQAVEFTKWPNWDRYWAKVSDSVRYESKYAPDRVPGLRLQKFTGLKMLKAIRPIVQLQRASYARKSMGYNRLKHSIRYAYYMIYCWRSLEVVLAVADDGVLAGYYGARIGGSTHYIYGGQRAGSSGANWYLLKEMTRQAYEASPDGRFVMGNVDYSIHEEETGGGLLRARRALRVSDFETAIVRFRFSGAAMEGHGV